MRNLMLALAFIAMPLTAAASSSSCSYSDSQSTCTFRGYGVKVVTTCYRVGNGYTCYRTETKE